jgi:hypothetical protein
MLRQPAPNGRATGSISNATLRQIDLQTGADLPGGCTTTIDTYAFDASIMPVQ